MALIRFALVLLTLAAFFFVGTPLHWLVGKVAPRAGRRIPICFCRSLLWLTKVRVETDGERLEGRPVLLAANHISWIDILALGGLTPFCFLAKSEVASWPVVSAFAKSQGTVFVDRKRRRSIPPANRALTAHMLEGRPVLLFPEGTTFAGAQPGRFHSSHFAAARDLLANSDAHPAVMIQPVALAYSSPAAAWVGEDDLLSHLWRTLRAPPLRCKIAFGRPIPFTRDEDRKRVAVLTRAAIVELLQAQPSMSRSAPAPGVYGCGRPADCGAS